MGWHMSDDAALYEQAATYQAQAGPRWWVMWSPGQYCYTAFYCSPAVIAPIGVAPGSDRDFLNELRDAEYHATRPVPKSQPCRGTPPRYAP